MTALLLEMLFLLVGPVVFVRNAFIDHWLNSEDLCKANKRAESAKALSEKGAGN